jgi:hypothetical protein
LDQYGKVLNEPTTMILGIAILLSEEIHVEITTNFGLVNEYGLTWNILTTIYKKYWIGFQQEYTTKRTKG